MHSPQTSGDLSSPLDFDVEFRARSAEPLIGSLLLEYDLGLFWKDITNRLADLMVRQAVNDKRADEQRHRQRSQHADHGAKSQVLKYAEATDELGK